MARPYKILCLIIIPEIMAAYYGLQYNTNYCAMTSCQDPSTHTGCIYRLGDTGKCHRRLTVLSDRLEKLEKMAIVGRHNEIRQTVAAGREYRGGPGPQPAATFIPDLTWDSELAALAQTWANQCSTDKDKCRNVDRFLVNQNIGMRESISVDDLRYIQEVLDGWYNEVQFFDYRIISNYTYDETTSHYTQMVWANTTKIGCGSVKYANYDYDVVLRYKQILVCNYGPGGNVPNNEIYTIKPLIKD